MTRTGTRDVAEFVPHLPGGGAAGDDDEAGVVDLVGVLAVIELVHVEAEVLEQIAQLLVAGGQLVLVAHDEGHRVVGGRRRGGGGGESRRRHDGRTSGRGRDPGAGRGARRGWLSRSRWLSRRGGDGGERCAHPRTASAPVSRLFRRNAGPGQHRDGQHREGGRTAKRKTLGFEHPRHEMKQCSGLHDDPVTRPTPSYSSTCGFPAPRPTPPRNQAILQGFHWSTKNVLGA